MDRRTPGRTLKASRSAGPRLFYGWWVASAAYAAAFGSVVFYNPAVLGVFVGPLKAEFDWDRAQVALAVSLGSLAAAAVAPVAGLVMDRRGTRWVIGFAALVMVTCALLLSRMQALWQFIALVTIGRAFASGAMQPAAFIAIANWFVRRRLFIVGITSTAQRLGAALLPLLATFVIALSGSWRTGWTVLAVVVAVSAAPALLVMYRRPEDRGLLPDGDAEPLASTDSTAAVAATNERNLTLSEATHTSAYWLIGISLTLMVFCGPSINFHQIPHLMDQGLSATEAAMMVAAGSLTGALGGVFFGMVASRITVRWTATCSLLGMAGGIVLLLFANNLLTALIFASVYGASFGAQVALGQMVYADYFGRMSMGVIRGSFQPVQLVMSAGGPYVVGLWYGHSGSYTAPFLTMSGLLIGAALLFSVARHPHHKIAAQQAVGAAGHRSV